MFSILAALKSPWVCIGSRQATKEGVEVDHFWGALDRLEALPGLGAVETLALSMLRDDPTLPSPPSTPLSSAVGNTPELTALAVPTALAFLEEVALLVTMKDVLPWVHKILENQYAVWSIQILFDGFTKVISTTDIPAKYKEFLISDVLPKLRELANPKA